MRYIGKGTHHVSLYIPFLTYVRHCNFTNLWPVISLSPIVRCTTSVATQPEKIEVFINDKPVYVYPGTTVLQVWRSVTHTQQGSLGAKYCLKFNTCNF